MDKRTPTQFDSLQETLGAYEREDCARFHMPGHKGRGLAGFWRDELAAWDVTELSRTDNLHAPNGAIAQAQREMANVYHAEQSFLVVNGSTNAVQAMILALENDDILLLSRDCHRCAIDGAALRGIRTETISPRYDKETGLLGMVTAEDLDRELLRTRATAVLITTPNAYGCCADISALSDTAHRHGALLLVDGAHGAHFPFSERLPMALGGKADLFAHSQHKTMDALTQAASLHRSACRIGEEQVRRALAMTETTSPSYLLMTSLDWSIYMAKRRDWSGQVERCIALEQKVETIDGLTTLHDAIPALGIVERDRTRIVIDVSARDLSGYEAQSLLEASGIYLEMADARRLVLITTPNDEPSWYDRLLNALAALPNRKTAKQKKQQNHCGVISGGERSMTIREAVFAQKDSVPLKQAAGRVASEAMGVYPPGIARVLPGERIDDRAILELIAEEQSGGALFGVRDGQIFVVRQEKV
jgi:arginine/lysine/ornithine decarboxylase